VDCCAGKSGQNAILYPFVVADSLITAGAGLFRLGRNFRLADKPAADRPETGFEEPGVTAQSITLNSFVPSSFRRIAVRLQPNASTPTRILVQQLFKIEYGIHFLGCRLQKQKMCLSFSYGLALFLPTNDLA
jgi:hypothetical protein